MRELNLQEQILLSELMWDIGAKIRALINMQGQQETEDYLRTFFLRPF
jgi:hypothetical protein